MKTFKEILNSKDEDLFPHEIEIKLRHMGWGDAQYLDDILKETQELLGQYKSLGKVVCDCGKEDYHYNPTDYIDYRLVEKDRVCNNCGAIMDSWAYGIWERVNIANVEADRKEYEEYLRYLDSRDE